MLNSNDMYTSYKFGEKEYRISRAVWKALIGNKPLTETGMMRKRVTILKLVRIGFDIVREDGRILGYDSISDRFYDTKSYSGQDQDGSSPYFDKTIILMIVGVILFSLICLAGRYILWKNNLPTVTPGMVPYMPLPDRIEYLEKEGRMDSINAVKVRSK
jgi:hypothetical protein